MPNLQRYMLSMYTAMMLIMLMFLLCAKNQLHFEWTIFSLMETEMTISVSFNYFNVLFLYTVFSIFSSVFQYSLSYMESELMVKRFLLILSSFAISMMILISSGNLFTSFLGWDGLGISSMLLIMYYSSYSSLKASMYTFMFNRLGDTIFLILMYFMLCKFPSLNFFLQSNMLGIPVLLSILLMIMSMTKSAQVPFSSWLTKAMEAPTPVSSLVHSSTLVTAGLFILFSSKEFWMNSIITIPMSIISLTTILYASLAGIMETDLKKIIAYSTLSQLGFIMLTFSMSMVDQGFFHLIMHAFFKALLFMSAGYTIMNSSGWQDIRQLKLNNSFSPEMIKMMMVSSMSLCGMPFLSGFYSKDFIIDYMTKSDFSIMLMIMLVFSFFLTSIYTIRFNWYMMKSMKTMTCDSSSTKMMKSMIYLFIKSCMTGSIIQWTLLSSLFVLPLNFPKIILVLMITMTMIFTWYSNTMNLLFKFSDTIPFITNWAKNKTMKLMMNLFLMSDLNNMIGKMLLHTPKMLDKTLNKLVKNFNNQYKLTMKELMILTMAIILLMNM